jgi:serine/threonine protein kinase
MAQPSVIVVPLADGTSLSFPQTFGHYTYVQIIGTGSFSTVILCRDQNGEFFAAKVVARSFLVQNQIFDRFEREVRALESLRHPNIVQLLNVVYTEDIIYLIMEYCSSGSLFDFMESHAARTWQLVGRIFKQIAEGIAFIHSHDIAHRDIKPDNILLDDTMTPHLADFGLCNTGVSQKLLSSWCGTPGYAAPEIVAATPYDGKAADVWSLGVVAFGLFTGRFPWESTSVAGLFAQITETDVEIPDALPRPLQELLAAMLNRDPFKRPTISQVSSSHFLQGIVVPSSSSQKLPILIRSNSERQRKAIDPRFKQIDPLKKSPSRDFPLSPSMRLTSLVRKVPAKVPLGAVRAAMSTLS